MTEQAYLYADEAIEYANARSIEGVSAFDKSALSGALLRASEDIDSHFVFAGEPLTKQQKRAWPRTGVRDENGRDVRDLPEEIKRAVIELAIAYLNSDSDAELLLGQKGHIQKEKIGNMSVSYQNSPSSRRSRLYHLLRPLLQVTGHTRILRS